MVKLKNTLLLLLRIGVSILLLVLLFKINKIDLQVLIKDIGGTVSESNQTTISFSGGQQADGQTSIVLQDAYAGIWLNPLSSGGWYLTQA